MEKQYLVSKAEEKDAFIVRRIYESLIGSEFYYKEYPMYSYCDCYTEITQNKFKFRWNTEIKHCNTNAYENFLLKEDKLNRMFQFTPDEYGLFLIYLCEGKAFIYNCKDMDWSKLQKRSLKQLICQLNPRQGYKYYNTYLIPKDKATTVIDYSKYLEEYEQLQKII